MCYSKERLQELYKESRRRHGIIEIETDVYSIKLKGNKILKCGRKIRKVRNKRNENLYRLCKESCKQ